MRVLSFINIFINIVITYIYVYNISNSPLKEFYLLLSYNNLKRALGIIYLKLIL